MLALSTVCAELGCRSSVSSMSNCVTGTECYCANQITINGEVGTVKPDSECTMPCAGDPAKKCGGGYRLDLYSATPPATTTTTTTSPTPTPTQPSGWTVSLTACLLICGTVC